MKKKVFLVLSLLLTLLCISALADVAIDKTNFPDKNFRKYVSINCDTDGNGVLSDSEIASVDYIDFDYTGLSVSNLKGIEHFSALSYLICWNNNLTSLDVSANKALTVLYCSRNELTSLDVSSNTRLEELECVGNQIKTLKLGKKKKLYSLYANDNKFKNLDISQCTISVRPGSVRSPVHPRESYRI